jgi:polysaccharide biosynthesis protein PslG
MLGRNRQTRRRAAGGLVGALAVVGTWALVAATAWAPPAATAEPRPFTQFGIAGTAVLRTTSDPARRARAYTALADVGASWIRVDVQWDDVERVRGRYDWVQLDRIVSGANAARLRVLALVHRTPKWARPTGNRAPTHPPVSASALQGYSTFMTRLAQRYTRPGARRIHAIEVWNEPNIPDFWSGGINPERYVALLKKAFVAVKAVNPATTVVTAGLAPAWDSRTTLNPRSYLRRIYGLGARNHFDAVAMHPYSYPYPPSQTGYNGWGNMIKAHGDRPSMRATMEANGDAAKSIWITEYGSPASTMGEDGQAALAVDAVRTWVTYPWAGPFFYFSLHDVVTKTMGLLRDDDSRRPVFEYLRAAIAEAKDPTEPTTTASPPG